MCCLACCCVLLLLLLATPTSSGATSSSSSKGRIGKNSRQARRNAKEQQSGSYDHLDPSWATFPAVKGDRARLSDRYTLGTTTPDRRPMTVAPELMTAWEDQVGGQKPPTPPRFPAVDLTDCLCLQRVPSKSPEAARGAADPLNMQQARKQGSRMKDLKSPWLHTDQLPPEAEVETLIDDPVTGTRLATISSFLNTSEVARLIELIGAFPIERSSFSIEESSFSIEESSFSIEES